MTLNGQKASADFAYGPFLELFSSRGKSADLSTGRNLYGDFFDPNTHPKLLYLLLGAMNVLGI